MFDSVCTGALNGSLYQRAITNETFSQRFGFDASQLCSDSGKCIRQILGGVGRILPSYCRTTGCMGLVGCVFLSYKLLWKFTLKFAVHNINLFLVVAHLSHKEFFSPVTQDISAAFRFALVSCCDYIRKIWGGVCPSAAAVLMDLLRGPLSIQCMDPKVLTGLINRQATVRFLKHQSEACSIFMLTWKIDENTFKSVVAMNFGLHLLVRKRKLSYL